MSDPALALLRAVEAGAATPRREGVVVYGEPWQRRLVALTASALEPGDRPAFASALHAELRARGAPDPAPAADYWAAWLDVFETLVGART